MKSYKELIVWQKSVEAAKQVYSISKIFPSSEKFGLTQQINRCAISIPSNIAEGYGRYHKKDFIRFLSIARGSLYEMQTQLILSEELDFVESSKLEFINSLSVEIDKMLNKLIKSLKESK